MGFFDKLLGRIIKTTGTPADTDIELRKERIDAKASDTDSSTTPAPGLKISYEIQSGDNSAEIAPSVPEEEKKYYQPDEYYRSDGVITFEDRKATSVPSENGLYVGEIMLLHYCTMGTYPHPKNGYPGLWWYNYGIRDVTSLLKTLEDRDFIKYGSVRDSVKRLKVAELKELLKKNDLSVTGKKDILADRVQEFVPESDLISIGLEPKYILTPKGQRELSDNEYIPFLCSNGNNGAPSVWYINKLIGDNKQNWKLVVENEWYNNSYEADKDARQSYPRQYEFEHSTEYRQMMKPKSSAPCRLHDWARFLIYIPYLKTL